MGDLIEPPPPTDLTQAPVRPLDDEEQDDLDDLRSGSSAKIDQLVHLLRLTPHTEKALVFSQFTGFLDKVCIFPTSFMLSCSQSRKIATVFEKEG